jgi:hypothetical protein
MKSAILLKGWISPVVVVSSAALQTRCNLSSTPIRLEVYATAGLELVAAPPSIHEI